LLLQSSAVSTMQHLCSVAPLCVLCASLAIWGSLAARHANHNHLSVDRDGNLRNQTNASGGEEQFVQPTEEAMQTVIRAFQAIIANENLAIGVVDRVDANAVVYKTRIVPGTSLKKYLGPEDVGTLGQLQLRVLPANRDYLEDPDFKSRDTARAAFGVYKFGINGSNGINGSSPRRWLEITRGTSGGLPYLPLTYLPWSAGTCTYTYMEPNTRAFLSGPFTGCVAYIAVKNDGALVMHCNRVSGESYNAQWSKVGQISQHERLKSQGWKDLKLIHQHGFKNKSGQVVPGWDLKTTGSHWLWGVTVDPNGPWTFGYIQNYKVNTGRRSEGTF